MSTPVTMPQLGESVSEGTVTRWLKQEGEQVEADEPLLEVSTDKVDTEIPAPTSGVLLQIKVQEDETVDVGSELAVIGEASEADGGGDGASGGAAPAAQDSAAQEQQQPQPEQPQPEQPQAQQAERSQQAEQPQAEQPQQPQPQPEPEQPAGSAGDGASGTPVTLPALGESVSEGTITRWLKQEGDQVQADEPLLEVSTDKVDTEIPAPTSGVLLQIKVQEDQTVDVGTELAIIGEASAQRSTGQSEQRQEQPTARASQQGQVATDESPADQPGGQMDQAQQQEPAGEEPQLRQELQERPSEELVSAPTPAPAPQPQAPSQQATQPAPDQPAPQQQAPAQGQQPQQPAQSPAQGDGQASGQGDGQADGGAYVTPLVRKLAAEHNVDLSALQGTGVGGRIRKQDVLEAARSQAEQPAPTEQPAAAAATAETPDGQPAPSPLRGRTEKMSRLRKIIAQRMVESLQVSAQLTTVVEVDVTAIARLRDRAKRDFEAREGVKLSFLPFFAKAALESLKAHPNVNASIDTEEGEITYHDAEHLGVAVDTERGLLVPVIQNAGDLNIGGLSRKIADLAERTRSNKVSPDELSGGTFTLTNTGSRGALFDTPIINQPQVAILGTGSVVKRPVVVSDPDIGEVIAIRSMVYLALTYDHRLVDGADAARFLSTVKARLEEGKFEAELGL